MPSPLHEELLELVRGQPQFAADLARSLLDIEIPPFSDAQLADSTLNHIVPVEYRADAVVVFVDPAPVYGVIIEAQLQPDDQKQFTWPVYVTTARARHRCPFILIVLTPFQATARWAAEPILIGGTMVHEPYVIGPHGIPKITDRERALREPQLAMLSVLAHGGGDVDVAVAITLAVTAAIEQFPEDMRELYSGLIEAALSDAAREELKMAPQVYKLFSESQRRSFAEGEAKGKAEGEAKGMAEGEAKGMADMLILILTQRQLEITAHQQRRITECSDAATLRHWAERAFAVASVDDLLG